MDYRFAGTLKVAPRICLKLSATTRFTHEVVAEHDMDSLAIGAAKHIVAVDYQLRLRPFYIECQNT